MTLSPFKHKRKAFYIASAALAVLLIFCSFSKKQVAVAHDGEDHDVVITMYDDFFEPKNVTITAGSRVTFLNAGQNLHWPASDLHPTHAILPEFDSLQGIQPDEKYSYIFNRSGEWRYHDHLFPEIVGKITVINDPSLTSSTDNMCICAMKKFVSYVGGIFSDQDDEKGLEVALDTNLISNENLIGDYIAIHGYEAAINSVSTQAEEIGDCHTAAHIIGREAFYRYGSEVFSNYITDCHSGVIHGATEGFLAVNGTDNLKENIEVICKSNNNRFSEFQCYHGVGHGLMAWASYDIHEALDICREFDSQLQKDPCYSGVFMENVVGGLSGYTGHTTEYLSSDYHMPCNVVDLEYIPQCYQYQSARMVQLAAEEGDYDFIIPMHKCSEIEYRSECYWGMGRDIYDRYYPDVDLMISTCTEHDYDDLASLQCIKGASAMFTWEFNDAYNGLEMCVELIDPLKIACHEILIEGVKNLTSNTPADFDLFCGSIELGLQYLCEQ